MQSKRSWFICFTSWLQCRDERKQLHPSQECTFYQFIHGPRTSWHGCMEVFGIGARTRGIVVCLFLQIALLKFSGMHKNFSWSVHYMVQFSIPEWTPGKPGWTPGNLSLPREALCSEKPCLIFLICKPSHNFVFCCELVICLLCSMNHWDV